MKKGFKIVYVVLFFTLLCVPMLLMPFFKNDASLEKRALAKFPAYLTEGQLNLNFSDEFESWVSDSLPLRAQLLTASNTLKGELLHTASSNVIDGKDGWLFYNTESADFLDTNALTDRQIRSMAVTLSLIEEDVNARGGRFTFVPAPNKSSVYGEMMPASFRAAPENNLTRLTAELKAAGAAVDLTKHNYIRLERLHVNQKPADGEVVLKGDVYDEAAEYAQKLAAVCGELGIDISQSPVIPGGHTSTYLFVNDESGDMQLAVSDMDIYDHLTPQVLHTQYISATAEGKACGAIDLLFDELLHKVFATYRYIDFGKSTSNDSADLNAQLIFQKEGFGARAVCYDTYEWTL